MTDYFFNGNVILIWPCDKVTKRHEERIIQADSEHDAYARLTNDILTEEVYSKAYPDNVKRIDIPGIEFNGTMTKAINSFERDETNERNG